jgi:N-acetylmuramoyl-L-alanine amidase
VSDEHVKIILSILVLIVVSTLLLATLGVLAPDPVSRQLTLAARGIQPAGSLGAGREENAVPGGEDRRPGATGEEPGQPADEWTDLPIAKQSPLADSSGLLDRWPDESAIPAVRTVDLDAYLGRAKDDRPLQGIQIFIDPGHGGSDSGATYPANAYKPIVSEAKINLAVAEKTRDALEQLGATVHLIREDDRWLSIFYRIAFASRELIEQFTAQLSSKAYTSDAIDALTESMDAIMIANSDFESAGGRGIMSGVGASRELKLLLDLEHQFPDVLYLSIHCNSLEDNDPTGGLQVFYLGREQAYAAENKMAESQGLKNSPPVYQMYRDEARRRLASLVKARMLSAVPQLTYHGEADLIEENFAVLREINVTNVLIELGFISSPVDRPILRSSDYQQKLAEAIADAVFAFYCTAG